MISMRAVFLGLVAVSVLTASAAAEVNVIYPPKRVPDEVKVPAAKHAKTAKREATVAIIVAPDRETRRESRTNVEFRDWDGPLNLMVILDDRRESRRQRTQRALFRNWTGFIDQYSGPRYPF